MIPFFYDKQIIKFMKFIVTEKYIPYVIQDINKAMIVWQGFNFYKNEVHNLILALEVFSEFLTETLNQLEFTKEFGAVKNLLLFIFRQ